MEHFSHRLFFLLLLFASIGSVSAQFNTSPSPYIMGWKKDAPLAAATVGMGTAYFFMNRKIQPFTPSQTVALNDLNINRFDRGTVNNFSLRAASISDILLLGSIALPAALFTQKKIRNNWQRTVGVGMQTVGLATTLTTFTKSLVKRPRPFMYNNMAPPAYYQQKDAQYSFFSGHTSITAVSCFMTAKMFHDFNPGSKLRPYVWGTAAVVPALAAYLRVRAGKHFPTDVIVGYIVGALVGVIVPELHKKNPFYLR
jgi:membrane-associated phospholipid phosphatase